MKNLIETWQLVRRSMQILALLATLASAANNELVVTNATAIQDAIDAAPLGAAVELYIPPGAHIELHGAAIHRSFLRRDR